MFEYIIENNEVTITSIIDESVTEITIPESIDGLPVTNINNRCLRFCNSLININISSSVNSIHYYTFSCCGSLTYINGVKLKIGVNIINNKFILWNKKIYVIKHQIGNDYYCDGYTNSHFISGKRYYDNFDKTSNYVGLRIMKLEL